MDLAYRVVNGLGRVALAALGAEVRVRGAEQIPRAGPVILAANHVAYPDFVFVGKAAASRGRRVRFLARHDVWRPGPLAWVMDAMGHVPVDRSRPVLAYLRARDLLRAGEAVGIFPEAGISYSYAVRSLMRGCAALARETGAPIVPVAIWGSQRIHSVGLPELGPDLTRGRLVDVRVGAPFSILPDADLVAATTLLGHVLTEMVERLQLSPEHQPRPGELAVWHPAHLGGRAPTRAEAERHDIVPDSAVRPTWGPDA